MIDILGVKVFDEGRKHSFDYFAVNRIICDKRPEQRGKGLNLTETKPDGGDKLNDGLKNGVVELHYFLDPF